MRLAAAIESAGMLIHSAGLLRGSGFNGPFDLRHYDGIHLIWERGHSDRQLRRACSLDIELAPSVDVHVEKC
jgi:hypothetical protein